MAEASRVRLGGYSPRGTTHSDALDLIATALRSELGLDVDVDYNVLDHGRQLDRLLADVEAGDVTACYFSTSYLAERVPEIGIVDLPYFFESLEHAHSCLDGELGRRLTEQTRASTGLVPLGYWDNGLRHLSNRLRPVLAPADCAGLRIRLQPNWAHEHYFAELGAVPVPTDLRDGIDLIVRGGVDAQENPLANFVAYGVERVHPQLTLTGHAYGARGVYASALQLARWTDGERAAFEHAVRKAIVQQRSAAALKEAELRTALEEGGTQVVELTAEARAAFGAAAEPVLAEARRRLGGALFDLAAG